MLIKWAIIPLIICSIKIRFIIKLFIEVIFVEIGNRIMELRKNNNFSQEELAEKIGVVRQTISKWELGETFPDIKQAKELSKIFNVSLDELVDNEKNILIEKISNTEKLAGIILKMMRVFVVGLIIFVVLMLFVFVIFRLNHKPMDELVDKSISIVCNLHNEEYSYQFDFNEESGQIIYAGGDAFLANITNIEKYSDAYQALDVIEFYVKNSGGTCTRTDDYDK